MKNALKNKGKKHKLTTLGFTLIELLAVIVILAIISVIATPIILNVIDETKKNAFKETVKGVERGIEISSTKEKIENEIEYKYEKGSWGENKVQIDGSVPKYVEVKVNKEGKIRYAITDGKYCVIKEYDGKESVRKIGNKNTQNVIQEKYCELDAVVGTSDDCFEYSENEDGTLKIINYYSYEKNDSSNKSCPRDVIIPNEINNKNVTTIGTKAFDHKTLKSVIIPKGIRIIENFAFYGNNLTNVTIPSTVVEIGGTAFRSCGLTELTLPEGVISIGVESFADNQISILNLPSTLTKIDNHAFRNNKLSQENAYIYKRNSDGSIDYSTIIGYAGESKNIEIPGEKNGVKLTAIGMQAFYYNHLTNITIPTSVISIGDSAFRKNKLTELTLPEGVISIGVESFADNQISSLILPTTLTTIGNHVFRNNKLSQDQAYIYQRNSDGSIDYSTLIGYGGTNTDRGKDIEIPEEKNGVKLITISAGAFSHNQLTTVKIPSTVTTIGNQAFYNNSLTSVIIKNQSDKVMIESNSFSPFDINNIKWEPTE